MKSNQEQEELAKKCVQAISEGGLDEQYFASNLTAWSGISGLMSRDDYLGKLKIVGEVFSSPLDFTFDAATVQPGRVVLQCRSKGLLFNGVAYSNDYVFIVEFDETGLIRHVREYFNTQRALETLVPAMQEWARRQGNT